jgi:hypothetical protein
MVFSEYALALCAWMGTLLLPMIVLYQIVRIKRRALRIVVRPSRQGSQS